jgi:hypothetical protein
MGWRLVYSRWKIFTQINYRRWKTARMIVIGFLVPFAFWKLAGLFQTANAIDSDPPP